MLIIRPGNHRLCSPVVCKKFLYIVYIGHHLDIVNVITEITMPAIKGVALRRSSGKPYVFYLMAKFPELFKRNCAYDLPFLCMCDQIIVRISNRIGLPAFTGPIGIAHAPAFGPVATMGHYTNTRFRIFLIGQEFHYFKNCLK
jgi:hypothetical protein